MQIAAFDAKADSEPDVTSFFDFVTGVWRSSAGGCLSGHAELEILRRMGAFAFGRGGGLYFTVVRAVNSHFMRHRTDLASN